MMIAENVTYGLSLDMMLRRAIARGIRVTDGGAPNLHRDKQEEKRVIHKLERLGVREQMRIRPMKV